MKLAITTIFVPLFYALTCSAAPFRDNGLDKRETRYLSGLEVVYADYDPAKNLAASLDENYLWPYDSRSSSFKKLQAAWANAADVNKGFGGKSVYIKRLWSTNKNDAKSYIEVWNQRTEKPGLWNLAKDAGGAYRYVEIRRRVNDKAIIDVDFYRGSSKLSSPPSGWNFMTGDLNEGRGGDYLYIIYRTDPTWKIPIF